MRDRESTPRPEQQSDTNAGEATILERDWESSLDHVDEALAELETLLGTKHFDEETIVGLSLGFREAFVNAVKHGPQSDPDKPGEKSHISVAASLTPRELLITIRDWGKGFDPAAVPDPAAPENLLSGHGRGLLYIKQFYDEFKTETLPAGFEVTLLKRFPRGEPR